MKIGSYSVIFVYIDTYIQEAERLKIFTQTGINSIGDNHVKYNKGVSNYASVPNVLY
jgi:hypothetical protein